MCAEYFRRRRPKPNPSRLIAVGDGLLQSGGEFKAEDEAAFRAQPHSGEPGIVQSDAQPTDSLGLRKSCRHKAKNPY